jgi:hypothetical protein
LHRLASGGGDAQHVLVLRGGAVRREVGHELSPARRRRELLYANTTTDAALVASASAPPKAHGSRDGTPRRWKAARRSWPCTIRPAT